MSFHSGYILYSVAETRFNPPCLVEMLLQATSKSRKLCSFEVGPVGQRACHLSWSRPGSFHNKRKHIIRASSNLVEGADQQIRSVSQLKHSLGIPSSPFGRNIVVGVDGTEECVAAFKWTLMNIYRNGDTVYVVHVMPDTNTGPAPGSLYYYPPEEPEAERCLWSQTREFINDYFVAIGRAQGVDVQVILVKEKHKGVGRALCRKAEELGASPLILAAHPKSRVEEMLTGSTSKFCVTHCKRPVLLLH